MSNGKSPNDNQNIQDSNLEPVQKAEWDLSGIEKPAAGETNKETGEVPRTQKTPSSASGDIGQDTGSGKDSEFLEETLLDHDIDLSWPEDTPSEPKQHPTMSFGAVDKEFEGTSSFEDITISPKNSMDEDDELQSYGNTAEDIIRDLFPDGERSDSGVMQHPADERNDTNDIDGIETLDIEQDGRFEAGEPEETPVLDSESGDDLLITDIPEQTKAEEASALQKQEEDTLSFALKRALGETDETFVVDIDEEVLDAPIDDLPEIDEEDMVPVIQEDDSKKRKRRKKKYVKQKISPVSMIVKITTAVVIVGLAVGLSVLIIWGIQDVMGFTGSREREDIEINIEVGDTLSDVAYKLEDHGVIRSATLFRVFSRYLSDEEPTLQYGKYTLSNGLSYSDILDELEKAGESTGVRILIREGETVDSIGDILQEGMICTKEDFIKAVNEVDYSEDFSFIASIIQRDPELFESRPYKLEGYLFPDTYEFDKNTSAEAVVRRMLRNFDNQITTYMRQQMNNKGYTVDDFVVMSSIIQAEAPDTDNMAKVAQIYWNRLYSDLYPKMQADPTTYYARDVLIPFGISQEIRDAYNTYQCEGLPMGAINNPGLEAFEAALDPDESMEGYYFFVTGREDGEFYYAKTNEEHEENVRKAGWD